MRSKLKETFLATAMLLAALLAPVAARPAAAEPTKRALLIGIDEYRTDRVKDLSGCKNDVELMRDLLVGKFGFAPENVVVLVNEEATRSAILAAIQSHLVAPSKGGDVAFLHYSGHGSQMIDGSDDEPDELDETILPHDARTEGVFDISDDEINGLMTQLSDKTPHVVFVLDSCHSGSAARAFEVGNAVRQVPADLRTPPAPEPFAAGKSLEAADDFRLPGAGYVMISGSRANELSNEARFEGHQHGALTHYLAKALLAAAGEKVTYRDVMERVQADVTARFPAQHPQLEGTGVDDVVFGVDRVTPRPYVLVRPAADDTVEIEAGDLFGVRPGTLLDVFPPGSKIAGAEPTGRIRVTEAGPLRSRGVLESGVAAPESRAVLEAISPPDFRVGVYFEDPPLSPTLDAVRRGLGEHESVEVVDDRAAADVRIRESGGKIRLEGRDLQTLREIDTGGAAAIGRAVQAVADWGRWFAVLAIDNPSPQLGIELSIERHERLAAEPEPAIVDAQPPGALREASPEVVPHGSWVRLRATNTSSQEVYVALLDLRSNGEIVVLHPKAQIREPVPPGKGVELVLPATVDAAEDRSVDWVKAIATSEPIPTEIFALRPRTRSTRTTGPPAEPPLQRYLRSWFQGGTRNLGGGGGGLEPVPVEGWAVAQKVLRVERDRTESRGIAVHFDAPVDLAEVGRRLATGQRSVCGPGGTDPGCYDLAAFEGDGTVVALRTPRTRSDAEGVSVGESFEEAYRVRRETGARRAEPLLALEVERGQDAPHPDDPDTRGGGGKVPHPRAADNAVWSLEYTRVPEAWADLRASRGRAAGAEAAGVVVAHPDTGYLEHPELWSAAPDGPLWHAAGWDYHGDDDSAVDEALDDQWLDNPVHGTGSGSAIVSPPGCQLAGATHCPTGGARGARLVPLRVNRSVVNFDTERISRAILDASGDDRSRVKAATDLSSIAMGGPPSWTLWKAVRTAERRGHLIVAAAGNYVKTVVWPARFSSTIAMAAVDAGCRPWAHSSLGSAVDFAAPGVDVWRATAKKGSLEFVTGIGTGTTYATATTSGIAALWIAKHRGTPAFERIRRDGRTTQVFRELVARTAWRPGGPGQPAEARCDPGVGWRPTFYGAGIVDAAALLAAPLPEDGAARGGEAEDVDDLPLWSSLYPPGTDLAVARADYRELFGVAPGASLEEAAAFEAEVAYHYATGEGVRETVDRVALSNARGDRAFDRIREELALRDLSPSLRRVLAQSSAPTSTNGDQ